VDADDDDLPLPCPACGYDLRGNASGTCPECGEAFDPARLAEAQIPWQDRHEIGRVRAFRRTVWLALRHPTQLARQATRPVRYRDARSFQLVCVTLAWLTIGPVAAWGLWSLREDVIADPMPSVTVFFDSPVGEASRPLALLADGSIVAAFLVGLFLWLLMGTGVASYFFHPASLPRAMQDRAVATSYYAAAPLTLLPVAGLVVLPMLGVAYLGEEDIWPQALAGALVIAFFGLATILVVVAFLATATLPERFIRRGLHLPETRSIACGFTVVVAGIVLFGLLVIGLPLAAFYAQLAWHVLRM